MPPLQRFDDITVVPLSELSRHVGCGGPVWPDFDAQTAPRHCRDGKPVDRCPEATEPLEKVEEPAVWGGILDLQFGHLVSEHMTRLPQSMAERPDDICLFAIKPGVDAAALPDWVGQALDWYGVPKARRRVVTVPLRVARLSVAAQGETLGWQRTEAAYLDLLDRNTARNGLTVDPCPVVYVSRAGLLRLGQGGHAGETYLGEVLMQVGVKVVDPARLSILDQCAVYAGAQVLVFAEGSAMHGRQLLGRVAQDIHVLRRRPNRDIGLSQLAPRCRDLRFHAAAGKQLGVQMPGGGMRYDLAPAFYDLDVVFGLFADLGFDLARHWDQDAYLASVAADLRGWFARCRTTPEQVLRNLELIAAAGVSLEPAATPNGKSRSHGRFAELKG